MKKIGISPKTIDFLKKLEKNNNREWFEKNKNVYLAQEEHMLAFTEALTNEMSKIDRLIPRSPKQTMMRIYRDIRFSKDKTPYKKNRSGGFKRDTNLLRGGYYYHIQPNNQSFVGGGFWGPSTDDLKLIRNDIAYDDKHLRKIIKSASFKKFFGELEGEELKTAPRGFDKDHPAIDLIRKKQYVIRRWFSDQEVMDDNFLAETVKTFKAMRPFFDYMSVVLTTDENGEPLYS